MVSIAQRARVAVARRRPEPRQVQCILRLSRVVSDLVRAEAFYCEGFGTVARGSGDPDVLRALGLRDTHAEERVMRLVRQDISLIRFAAPGRPYPQQIFFGRRTCNARRWTGCS